MADEPEPSHDDDKPQLAEEDRPPPAEGVLQPRPISEMAVHRQPPAVVWRKRALALRDALPELARNPVVAGAGAAAATIALRLAVDVVTRRVLGTPPPARPAALDVTGHVTGHVVHHVHVFHHVRVIHHTVHRPADYVALRPLLPPPRG